MEIDKDTMGCLFAGTDRGAAIDYAELGTTRP